jgi:hypothetical protein
MAANRSVTVVDGFEAIIKPKARLGKGMIQASAMALGQGLSVTEYIIRKCVLQSVSTEFNYSKSVLDGLVLERRGVIQDCEDSATLNICSECTSALSY